MIWELMKHDPALQVMPVVALMVIGPALLVPAHSGGVYFLMTIPFIITLGVPGFRQRYTLFQATLPIAGKQLFLARIGSLMACVWLPIVSAVALTALLRSDLTWADRLPLFEAGAVITVAVILVQCVRVQTINPPAWLVVVAYAGMFSPLFMLGEFFLPQPTAAGAALLGGCALVSAVLFLKAWAEVPKSFQLAPAEPVSARSGHASRAWPTANWWLVFRSPYGWQASLSLFAVFTTMLFGGAVFALCIVAPAFFVTCRLGLRWLLHLPVSLRKVFCAMWIPLTAAMIAGMAFASEMELTRRLYGPPKTRMVIYAVILLAWMIQICGLQLYGWNRLRNKSFTVRIMLAGAPSFVGYASFMVQLFLLWIGATPRNLDPLFGTLVVNLASVLPDNLWLIGLMSALPIAGLYWLAEKLFRDMELGQIEIQAQRTLARQS